MKDEIEKNNELLILGDLSYKEEKFINNIIDYIPNENEILLLGE